MLPILRQVSTGILALSMWQGVQAAEWPLPLRSPSRAGFSEERLRRVDTFCESQVRDGRYSSLVVLLAREGKIVEWKSFGYRDRAAAVPLKRDDIFAIASLSKIVTTVGALMLVEEGKITLREPIARFLPEFGAMKVMVGGTVDAPELVNSTRPITLHDLLTHTAGFSNFESSTSGLPTTSSLIAAIRDRRNAHPETLRAMARELAALPLQRQPGEAWIYGPSTDLVGALVEAVSGQPFDQYLEQRVFRPLRMRDTGFEVAAEKRSRQVTFDARQTDGSLKPVAPKPRGGAWPSGGGGLYSTPADYVRFAQMLLNRGQLEGVRLLSPKTIELMTQDHLHGIPKPTKIYPVTDGFGYGVEIRTDLARSQWLGTAGTFGWNGASTAYCGMDPKEGLIAMVWSQHSPNSEFELFERFNNLVYQAFEH